MSTKDKAPECIGCEFVKIMSEDGTGYCQVHGDIEGTPKRDNIIEKLGGNDLSLEDE